MSDILKSRLIPLREVQHLAACMTAEITMDSLFELADERTEKLPNNMAIMNRLEFDKIELREFSRADAEAGMYASPGWSPASSRVWFQNRSASEVIADAEPVTQAGGLVNAEFAVKKLQLVAAEHKLKLSKKLREAGNFRGWFMGTIVEKIVARALGCAVADVFSRVFNQGPRRLTGLQRILTSVDKWVGVRPQKNAEEGKFNGSYAVKRRVGRPAYSEVQWALSYRRRYLNRLKYGGDRRMKRHVPAGIQEGTIAHMPSVKIPPTKYPRPEIGRKRKNKGSWRERIGTVLSKRIPRRWTFWNEGWEYWRDYFVEPLADELIDITQDVVRDQTKRWTKDVMDTINPPKVKAKIRYEKVKLSPQKQREYDEWIMTDGTRERWSPE